MLRNSRHGKLAIVGRLERNTSHLVSSRNFACNATVMEFPVLRYTSLNRIRSKVIVLSGTPRFVWLSQQGVTRMNTSKICCHTKYGGFCTAFFSRKFDAEIRQVS
jgi:hypothetical protein